MGTARYDTSYSIEQMYPSIPGKCSCGCGAVLTGRRRRWANDKCGNRAATLFLIRKGHSGTVREAVWRRDHGVCARCGKDTAREQRYWRETFALWMWLARRNVDERVRVGTLHLIGYPHQYAAHKEARRLVCEDIWRATGIRDARFGHWWEAHHKLAVAEGGGGCDLDGFETLCLPCHKAETKALRQRLSGTKEKAFQPELLAR